MITSRLRANEVWRRSLLYCATRLSPSATVHVQGTGRSISSGKGSPSTTASSRTTQAGIDDKTPRIIDPVNLTGEDVSRVYCVSKEELKSIFPHKLSTKFAGMVDVLGRGCWILRRQSYEIMKALRDFSPGDTKRNAKFLLSGGDGCGKSLCLSQVVHWGVKSGWTVIHVPSVFLWTHSKEEVRSSMKHPGTYDQPKEAVTWLKNFKSLNGERLSQMQLSKDHSWTKREKSETGDSLTKVIEQGLLHPPIATEIVGVVLEEVAMEANKSKTLLAMDDFDGCFSPTFIKLGRNEWAKPDQLNLVKHFVSAVSPGGYFPGGMVLALSRAKMSRHRLSTDNPMPLFKDEALDAAVAGFTEVEVPQFERKELDNCINYYIQEKWLNKVITPERGDELWCLSFGNPAELHRLCAAL